MWQGDAHFRPSDLRLLGLTYLADLPEFGIPEFFGPREEGRAIANAETAYPNCTFTETSDRHLAHCSQLRLSALIPAKKIVTR
jgi:hypothetical protein